MLTHTSIASAPWYIIPADHKWFTRAAVADVIVARLEALDLNYPLVSAEERALLLTERDQLLNEASPSRVGVPDGESTRASSPTEKSG